jgi:cytochrome P450
MTVSHKEKDVLRDLRARSYTEGSVFWIDDDELAVFDPDIAQQINTLNFTDLTLPDKLADLLRGRTSKPFSWKQVRAAWNVQVRRLSEPDEVEKLATHMSRLLDKRLDCPRDLVWVAQEVCARSLIPLVINGLRAADTARVLRDQTLKISRLLMTEHVDETLWKKSVSFCTQVSAGLVVRRELQGRAAGRRPRQLDLTDPIIDLLPELGMDRAVHVVTGVLTAIAGPPGAAAACLLYELIHQPDWAERLSEELEAIPLPEFYAAPTHVAPVTHRFVKETLRMWSPTPIMNRIARTDINHTQVCLKVGQSYLLSPDIIHHDPQHWKDPDTFDPDRWVPETSHAMRSSACYVPFGWSPRGCIGASLGTTQLMLLCYLLCTRYRIQLSKPEAVRMVLVSVPLPLNFHGTITRR